MLKIETVGGFCPCQAEGTFDGNPFYFRARHGEWQLNVVAPSNDPVDASLDWAPSLYQAVGDDPSYGYMLPEDAERILSAEYEKFINTRKTV